MNSAEEFGPGPAGSVEPGATPQTTRPKVTTVLDWLDHVGPGWVDILVALHADLSSLDPHYDVAQVKEKFGELRVYLQSEVTWDMDQAIDAATALSQQTCEVCGLPGRIRNVSGFYVKCVCDACGPRETAAAQRRREELQQRS